MSAARLASTPVTFTGADAYPLADRVAALTRAAYRHSDPFTGLPVPDGAFETTTDVTRALSDGGFLIVSQEADGVLRGALRVAVRDRDTWHIERVAVDPGKRGTGIASELLSAVDRAACVEGIRRITLHAVVERCLPPIYARLGFDVVGHWPSDDKPLTEVTMERCPGAPARVSRLPIWRAGTAGVVVCWLLSDRQLVRVVTPCEGGDPLGALTATARHLRLTGSAGSVRLAGVDVWTGPGDPPDPTPTRRFASDRSTLVEHVTPRLVDPAMWSAWRFRPGTEPSDDEVVRASGRTAW